MAELKNNRESMLPPDNIKLECQREVNKTHSTIENSAPPDINNPKDDSTATKFIDADHISLISKSTLKSFSRLHPRNVVGTIGRKTSSLLTRRTLRSRRSSLRSLNQGWDTVSQFSSLENESVNSNSQEDGVIQKQNQQLQLAKNYTLRLRKIKEKFKTRRHSKRDRFGTLQIASPNRFRKDLNKSKIESNNRQEKLLEKLLKEHNKHLDSL